MNNMKRYASYTHLSSCEIGEWQGVIRGRDYNIRVPRAIDYLEDRRLGLEPWNTNSVVITVLLADFLFHKIKFPENKSRRVRAIKNKLQIPRRRFDRQRWAQTRSTHIDDMLALLRFPVRQEGENTVDVGPFTLQNPINLDSQKVEEMVEVCTKALTLCTNSLAPNFTQALYGDVVLVEKLGRANWYAWYSSSKDEITMKYMDRDKEEFMKTFIHEIGHRYYQKNLNAEKRSLWYQYDRKCARAQKIKLSDWDGQDIGLYAEKKRNGWSLSAQAKAGSLKTTLIMGSNNNALMQTIFGGGGADGLPRFRTEKGDVAGPYQIEGIKKHIKAITGLYPTKYATTDVEEHFCEAIAYKALGKLHPKSLEAFNSIILNGVAFSPDASNFKGKYVPEDTPPPSRVVEPTAPEEPTTPTPVVEETPPPQRTQVEQTRPTKQELVRSCESLASQLGLGFKKGRKYGLFIYTNDAVGSTHAYMFIDYSTGNLFAPKAKDAPNLRVNIGNITDSGVADCVNFDRMNNLRPRWRTMNSITQPTQSAPPTEVIDQTPEPTIPTTPEGNLDSIREAAKGLSRNLPVPLEYQEMRKFIRLIYTNIEQGTKHSYLFINKQSGSVHPPKAHDAPKKNVSLGSILEPGILSKVNYVSMTNLDKNWRKKYTIKGR